MSSIRPIEPGDRATIRALVEGTRAFKPHEVDVAMEIVDACLSRPDKKDYHPFVLVEKDGTVVSYACFGKNEMTAATFDLYWLPTRADRMGEGEGRRSGGGGGGLGAGEIEAVSKMEKSVADRIFGLFSS